MSIKIHLLNTSGVFNGHEKKIKTIIRRTYAVAKQYLVMPDIDVVVQKAESPHFLKKMGGIGGYCPNAHTIEISIDLDHKDVQASLEEALIPSLLHEMHHAARWASGVKFQDRLQDILITEGLADHFVFELTGKKNPWVIKLTKKDQIRFKTRILKERAKKDYNYEDWFILGSKKRHIPRWTGYAIGWSIVYDYIEKTGSSAACLVDTPSDILLKV